RQEARLGVCGRCGKPLPQGCGGEYMRTAANCWYTRDCLDMNLTSPVTGHASPDEDES
ncbi:hypothetical protein KYB21_004866, partial [Salmonella enterica]|nr:hypothetical protein [Salmonella enterica]